MVFALMRWLWEQHLGVLELKCSYSAQIDKIFFKSESVFALSFYSIQPLYFTHNIHSSTTFCSSSTGTKSDDEAKVEDTVNSKIKMKKGDESIRSMMYKHLDKKSIFILTAKLARLNIEKSLI